MEEKYRSKINVPFRVCSNAALESKFIAEAAQANLIELKGHKTVGGCRASLYNAMPVEGVLALIAFMTQFKERNPTPSERAAKRGSSYSAAIDSQAILYASV